MHDTHARSAYSMPGVDYDKIPDFKLISSGKNHDHFKKIIRRPKNNM